MAQKMQFLAEDATAARERTTAELRSWFEEHSAMFALAVAKLAPGSWQGPIESGFGWHLVFVDSVIPGRVPAFEEIEPDVHTAWSSEQKTQAWENAYQKLPAEYTVLLPKPPESTGDVSPLRAANEPRH